MNDGLLDVKMFQTTHLIAFAADPSSIIVLTKTQEELKEKSIQSFRIVKDKLKKEIKLPLAKKEN